MAGERCSVTAQNQEQRLQTCTIDWLSIQIWHHVFATSTTQNIQWAHQRSPRFCYSQNRSLFFKRITVLGRSGSTSIGHLPDHLLWYGCQGWARPQGWRPRYPWRCFYHIPHPFGFSCSFKRAGSWYLSRAHVQLRTNLAKISIRYEYSERIQAVLFFFLFFLNRKCLRLYQSKWGPHIDTSGYDGLSLKYPKYWLSYCTCENSGSSNLSWLGFQFWEENPLCFEHDVTGASGTCLPLAFPDQHRPYKFMIKRAARIFHQAKLFEPPTPSHSFIFP